MKKWAIPLMLVLLLTIQLLPLVATADSSNNASYSLVEALEDYFLYSTAEYPWTGLAAYTSGNAGGKDTISTLKLVSNASGVLKFDWSIFYFDNYSYFAYRKNMEYLNYKDITSQTDKYTGDTMGSESGIYVEKGDVVYFSRTLR